jgi:hypothetical protein
MSLTLSLSLSLGCAPISYGDMVLFDSEKDSAKVGSKRIKRQSTQKRFCWPDGGLKNTISDDISTKVVEMPIGGVRVYDDFGYTAYVDKGGDANYVGVSKKVSDKFNIMSFLRDFTMVNE